MVASVAAGHFRTAMVSWQKIPSNSGRLVEFTIETSWMRNYGAFKTAYEEDNTPTVGDTVLIQGGMPAIPAGSSPVETKFYTGDGQSYFLNAVIKQVYAGENNDNEADDYFVAVSKVQHEYAGNGPYTAFFGGCCRWKPTDPNWAAGYRIESQVHFGKVEGSFIPKSLHTVTITNPNDPALPDDPLQTVSIYIPAVHSQGHPAGWSADVDFAAYADYTISTSKQMGGDVFTQNWVRIDDGFGGRDPRIGRLTLDLPRFQNHGQENEQPFEGSFLTSVNIAHIDDMNAVATAEVYVIVKPFGTNQPEILLQDNAIGCHPQGTADQQKNCHLTPTYLYDNDGNLYTDANGDFKYNVEYVGFPVSFNIVGQSDHATDTISFLHNILPKQTSCSEMGKVCSDLSNVCSDKVLACSDTTPVCYENRNGDIHLLADVTDASDCVSHCADDPSKMTVTSCNVNMWYTRSWTERMEEHCASSCSDPGINFDSMATCTHSGGITRKWTARRWEVRNEAACKSSCTDRQRSTEESCVSDVRVARSWTHRVWNTRSQAECMEHCSDGSDATQDQCWGGCTDKQMGSSRTDCKSSCDIPGLSQAACESSCIVNGKDMGPPHLAGSYPQVECANTCVGGETICFGSDEDTCPECTSVCRHFTDAADWDDVTTWDDDPASTTEAACESSCTDSTISSKYDCKNFMADGTPRVWTEREWFVKRWETRKWQPRTWNVRTWNDRFWQTRSFDYREQTMQCSDPTKFSKDTCVPTCSDPTKATADACGSSCMVTTGAGASEKTEEDRTTDAHACVDSVDGPVPLPRRTYVHRVWTVRTWTLPACEGSCDDPTKPSKDACTSCSDPEVKDKAACVSCSDPTYVCAKKDGTIDHTKTTEEQCVSSCSSNENGCCGTSQTCVTSNGVTRVWTSRTWQKRDEYTCKSTCTGDPTRLASSVCTSSCNDATKTNAEGEGAAGTQCTGGVCTDRTKATEGECTSTCSDVNALNQAECNSDNTATRIWTERLWTDRVWSSRTWAPRSWKPREWSPRTWIEREMRSTMAEVTNPAANPIAGVAGMNPYSSTFNWIPRQPGWYVFCFEAILSKAPAFCGNACKTESSQHCVDIWVKDDMPPQLSLQSNFGEDFNNALFSDGVGVVAISGQPREDIAAYLGGNLKFTVIASDSNHDDVVQFGDTTGLPDEGLANGATVQATTGNPAKLVFSWVPSLKAGGKRKRICFQASDSAADARSVDTVKACVYVTVTRCKYMIGAQDTMSSIAEKFKTNYVQVYALNNLLRGVEGVLQEGMNIWVGSLYEVQEGDTFKKLAKLFETTEQSIFNMNTDINTETVLQTGAELCIIPNSCQVP